MTGTTNN